LTHFTITPNIASVISSPSNANGSSSAFLFAAASEPEVAFSAAFSEACARQTSSTRQYQKFYIDRCDHTPLSPRTPRAHIHRFATRVSPLLNSHPSAAQ
jgi:hypothetical protein